MFKPLIYSSILLLVVFACKMQMTTNNQSAIDRIGGYYGDSCLFKIKTTPSVKLLRMKIDSNSFLNQYVQNSAQIPASNMALMMYDKTDEKKIKKYDISLEFESAKKEKFSFSKELLTIIDEKELRGVLVNQFLKKQAYNELQVILTEKEGLEYDKSIMLKKIQQADLNMGPIRHMIFKGFELRPDSILELHYRTIRTSHSHETVVGINGKNRGKEVYYILL